ncbi:MAG: type VI secretion system contractile sheath small subunit [Nannocystaceae bacterium]
MSREHSVAPKERVNITYASSVDGAQEEVELPLRILMIGDFTGRPDERTIEERAPIAVDKDNFDKVLASQDLTLSLQVPDSVSESGGELEVQLAFQSLRDFRPEAIAEQVPELRRLLELRKALVALKGPLANRPRFAREIERILADPQARERLTRELALPAASTPDTAEEG